MRWQDQSEAPALFPYEDLLARLNVADLQRLQQADNGLPRVVIFETCLRAIRDDIELSQEERGGGLLVGRAYGSTTAKEPQAVVAERGIASRAFDSTGVSLRMESEVWNLARPLLKEGLMIVGWYHSHPNLGAFFSETDRSTQRNFFRHPFSLGLVVDPIRNEMCAFVGTDSMQIPSENVIVPEGQFAT